MVFESGVWERKRGGREEKNVVKCICKYTYLYNNNNNNNAQVLHVFA